MGQLLVGLEGPLNKKGHLYQPVSSLEGFHYNWVLLRNHSPLHVYSKNLSITDRKKVKASLRQGQGRCLMNGTWRKELLCMYDHSNLSKVRPSWSTFSNYMFLMSLKFKKK